MERKKAMLKTGCLRMLVVFMAVILCTAPILRADVTIPASEEWDIDWDVHYDIDGTIDPTGTLWVYGTANVLPGAVITDVLLVGQYGTANIYGGDIAPYIMLDAYPAVDIPLTVYGTDFTINTFPVGYGVQMLYGGGTLAGKYEDGTSFNISIFGNSVNLQPPPSDVIEVTIDIKPGSDDNTINLGSNGVIPVAILSDTDFDAMTVDPTSVSLAGSDVAVRGKGKLLAHEEDVNGDGMTDLIVQVETENLDPGQFQNGSAILTGKTTDGTEFTGSDSINIVPPA